MCIDNSIQIAGTTNRQLLAKAERKQRKMCSGLAYSRSCCILCGITYSLSRCQDVTQQCLYTFNLNMRPNKAAIIMYPPAACTFVHVQHKGQIHAYIVTILSYPAMPSGIRYGIAFAMCTLSEILCKVKHYHLPYVVLVGAIIINGRAPLFIGFYTAVAYH